MKTLAKENSHTRLPIHLITGFLGSGKTTLLNQLVHQPGMQNTVVIVNEFGEISVDHLLVKATTEDMMVLEGGCVCCSVRFDLLNTLEDLFHKRARQEISAFEQILIETTGLADPAPILRTLINDPFIVAHYRLEIVVTTVDVLYGAQQLDEYDESVKQAALANHLILTKIDLIDAKMLENFKHRLRRLNPTAILHEVNLNQQTIEAATLFNTSHYHLQTQKLDIERWLQADVYLKPQKTTQFPISHQHDAYIKTFCIEHTEPLHWLTLERWIQQLTRLRGKDLLRVKGIAYTYETDLPVVIQGVQHIFQPPSTLDAWPTSQRRSQIVFITRNLEKKIVEQVLYALIDSQTPAEVCQAALILLGQN
ncbi:MAG: GTP-binding protein [Gammaproteobacteria bacterium]|nr:MAG: GTP-binding protein [Gammaproteobacteria bacterium]RKZ38374.1 MAG: GTP-binding protein [Gammaproteobacteria bacterium]RKZ76421.1 MAG: GTP-binding protein [Gammaproteobacteria bacterium]